MNKRSACWPAPRRASRLHPHACGTPAGRASPGHPAADRSRGGRTQGDTWRRPVTQRSAHPASASIIAGRNHFLGPEGAGAAHLPEGRARSRRRPADLPSRGKPAGGWDDEEILEALAHVAMGEFQSVMAAAATPERSSNSAGSARRRLITSAKGPSPGSRSGTPLPGRPLPKKGRPRSGPSALSASRAVSKRWRLSTRTPYVRAPLNRQPYDARLLTSICGCRFLIRDFLGTRSCDRGWRPSCYPR